MKIALDPTPFHHDYELLEFPRVVAELGYENLQLTPHRDFIPFYNHPRADDALVAQFRKACADAGGDEHLDVDMFARRGLEYRDLRILKTFGCSGIS